MAALALAAQRRKRAIRQDRGAAGRRRQLDDLPVERPAVQELAAGRLDERTDPRQPLRRQVARLAKQRPQVVVVGSGATTTPPRAAMTEAARASTRRWTSAEASAASPSIAYGGGTI